MAIAEREIIVPVQTAAEDFTDEDFVPQPYHWTREQFNDIGDMGLFEGRRAISVEGEILAMPAMKKPHQTALVLADEAFRAAFGPRYFMSMQSPFGLAKRLIRSRILRSSKVLSGITPIRTSLLLKLSSKSATQLTLTTGARRRVCMQKPASKITGLCV